MYMYIVEKVLIFLREIISKDLYKCALKFHMLNENITRMLSENISHKTKW